MATATITPPPVCAKSKKPVQALDMKSRIDNAYRSESMRHLRAILEPMGAVMPPDPIIHKYLDDRFLRVMFPVALEPVEDGTVAAIALLYDCESETTLYAHPMHAGPAANPLVQYVYGPMASPKSQAGDNGDRATARFLEHKKAIWARYCRERDTDRAAATARWRKDFHWSLRRLYLCAYCAPCRWGNPVFDPWENALRHTSIYRPMESLETPVPDAWRDIVTHVQAGALWRIEEEYAQRGGWQIGHSPWLIARQDPGMLRLIFPTNARLIQGGTIAALMATVRLADRETVHMQAMVVGAETEILFRHGEALGLPTWQTGAEAQAALINYMAWRRQAWTEYHLNELDKGMAFASEQWLAGFWNALGVLFGGNECAQIATVTTKTTFAPPLL